MLEKKEKKRWLTVNFIFEIFSDPVLFQNAIAIFNGILIRSSDATH